ncbi:MAG: 50S ribosomal protein L6 [Candidatus Omnitrophica bacterium]|nr:50S ribosomal protein L6 [Candidatus Omnitrophota bacterium]
MSRIGKKALSIPKEIKLEIKDHIVHVQGPKGNLDLNTDYRIDFEVKDGTLFVTRKGDSKLERSLHGLYRALIANMFIGVIEGYKKEMEVVGVGYKVAVQGKILNLQLGFSHPINFSIPEGIKIETPKPTFIIITGINKELVGEVAAKIRKICPPEPYKGKGIRFSGEFIKKKVGKAQGATSK